MKGFFLAAGLGTRLRPITDKLAKPAVSFLNIPMLYWSYEFVRPLLNDDLIVNLHHLPETVRSLTSKIRDQHVVFSHEVAAPLGSGGALTFARSHLKENEDLVVANADEVILPQTPGAIDRMAKHHRESGAIATLLTMRHADAGGKFGGVWHQVDSQGARVLGFGRDASRYPDAIGALHYVGVLIVNTRILRFLPAQGESNLLYDGLIAAIQSGERVNAHVEDLMWFETGNQNDFLQATSEALPFLSIRRRETSIAQELQRTISMYADEPLHFTERHGGGQLPAGSTYSSSLPEEAMLDVLEKEKAFAVIGKGALIEAPLINSVALPGARIQQSVRDQLIL